MKDDRKPSMLSLGGITFFAAENLGQSGHSAKKIKLFLLEFSLLNVKKMWLKPVLHRNVCCKDFILSSKVFSTASTSLLPFQFSFEVCFFRFYDKYVHCKSRHHSFENYRAMVATTSQNKNNALVILWG